jgi:hypothetical protein
MRRCSFRWQCTQYERRAFICAAKCKTTCGCQSATRAENLPKAKRQSSGQAHSKSVTHQSSDSTQALNVMVRPYHLLLDFGDSIKTRRAYNGTRGHAHNTWVVQPVSSAAEAKSPAMRDAKGPTCQASPCSSSSVLSASAATATAGAVQSVKKGTSRCNSLLTSADRNLGALASVLN